MRIALFVGCLAALLSLESRAQTRELSTGGVLLDRVAAVVNDGIVLKSELDIQMTLITQRLQQQRTELPPQNVLRQQILERLVLQEVQLQRAERLGVKVSDEMLNTALKDVADRNQIPLDQLPEALAAQGLNYAAYRDSMRDEMTISMLRQRDVLTRINVTPRELEQFIAKQSATENQEYNVSHILLSLPQAAEPGQIDAVTERAQDVYKRAKGGEDFAQLAVSYSNGQTALEGGALGWRKGAQLPGFIADIVAKMQPGDVSEPVRTPSGFHIVRLNDKRGASETVMVNQVHARHILIRPNALRTDDAVRAKLEELRTQLLAGEDFGKLAQANSEDPASAAEGGDLGWTGPGTFVPEFEKAIRETPDNEISQPFRTQYGWHIVQVLERRMHDNTAEATRQKAFAALRESKAEEETEVWLRRLRDEAFIEYRM
jgi:peptidyl-prolyl cis-trans isomerase SurA